MIPMTFNSAVSDNANALAMGRAAEKESQHLLELQRLNRFGIPMQFSEDSPRFNQFAASFNAWQDGRKDGQIRKMDALGMGTGHEKAADADAREAAQAFQAGESEKDRDFQAYKMEEDERVKKEFADMNAENDAAKFNLEKTISDGNLKGAEAVMASALANPEELTGPQKIETLGAIAEHGGDLDAMVAASLTDQDRGKLFEELEQIASRQGPRSAAAMQAIQKMNSGDIAGAVSSGFKALALGMLGASDKGYADEKAFKNAQLEAVAKFASSESIKDMANSRLPDSIQRAYKAVQNGEATYKAATFEQKAADEAFVGGLD